ncbi:hypothetical protein Bbelb_340970 [Branchiostoma belcheri]|nr:hypothetical protein Bbelb_340970 [Branchiostoma belcheri]
MAAVCAPARVVTLRWPGCQARARWTEILGSLRWSVCQASPSRCQASVVTLRWLGCQASVLRAVLISLIPAVLPSRPPPGPDNAGRPPEVWLGAPGCSDHPDTRGASFTPGRHVPITPGVSLPVTCPQQKGRDSLSLQKGRGSRLSEITGSDLAVNMVVTAALDVCCQHSPVRYPTSVSGLTYGQSMTGRIAQKCAQGQTEP